MSVWLRAAAASALVAILAVPSPARAQTASERAEALNSEGRDLFRDEDYAAAVQRFEQAAELSPEPRFYFNLCFGLYMAGDLHGAIEACDQVQPPGADGDLIDKREHVMGLIDEEIEEHGGYQPGPGSGHDSHDPGQPGSEPGRGGDGDQAGYDAGRSHDPTQQARRERRTGPQIREQEEIHQDYSWSLGAELGAYANLGVGGDNYDSGGVHLRLFADFILSSRQRLGLQAYAHFSHFALGNAPNPTAEELTFADLGGALFQHIPIAKNIYFTPLAGLHLAIQQPDFSDVAFMTVGARGQASFDFVFGSEDQHAVSLTPVALNLYLPSGGGARGQTAADFGLDSGGATYALTAGYTFRFSQPFGGSLITLE